MAAQPSTPPPTTPSTPPSTTPSILSLGDDVLLNVFELLSSEEILALRKVRKSVIETRSLLMESVEL